MSRQANFLLTKDSISWFSFRGLLLKPEDKKSILRAVKRADRHCQDNAFKTVQYSRQTFSAPGSAFNDFIYPL